MNDKKQTQMKLESQIQPYDFALHGEVVWQVEVDPSCTVASTPLETGKKARGHDDLFASEVDHKRLVKSAIVALADSGISLKQRVVDALADGVEPWELREWAMETCRINMKTFEQYLCDAKPASSKIKGRGRKAGASLNNPGVHDEVLQFAALLLGKGENKKDLESTFHSVARLIKEDKVEFTKEG
jgi:hypothetical protein